MDDDSLGERVANSLFILLNKLREFSRMGVRKQALTVALCSTATSGAGWTMPAGALLRTLSLAAEPGSRCASSSSLAMSLRRLPSRSWSHSASEERREYHPCESFLT